MALLNKKNFRQWMTILPLLAFLLIGCQPDEATITICNTLSVQNRHEVVEMDYAALCQRMGTDVFGVYSEDGKAVPTQLTHDGKLIFPVVLNGNSEVQYTVRKGDPALAVDTLVRGRVYPERDDDVAWENEYVAFRAYGPALQARGEQGFGYDLFLKHGAAMPMLDRLYAEELNLEKRQLAKEWMDAGRKAEADSLLRSISYHIDHGLGMDCYAVGPTLGAGVTALVADGKIVYSWCYEAIQILDNGPLRFRMQLTYRIVLPTGKEVVEHRDITLDAGSHLNRTMISYEGLEKEMPIVTGFSLHDDGERLLDPGHQYMSYLDPTQGEDNGELYVGILFANPADSICERTDGDKRHLVGCNRYASGQTFTYYWGYGWNRADVADHSQWNALLEDMKCTIKTPLKIKIK